MNEDTNPRPDALAEVATGNGCGDRSQAPAAPGFPPEPGALLSRAEATERLEAYWAKLHTILWLDWDLGRADRKEMAKQWTLYFLAEMGFVESVVSSRGDESLTPGS